MPGHDIIAILISQAEPLCEPKTRPILTSHLGLRDWLDASLTSSPLRRSRIGASSFHNLIAYDVKFNLSQIKFRMADIYTTSYPLEFAFTLKKLILFLLKKVQHDVILSHVTFSPVSLARGSH